MATASTSGQSRKKNQSPCLMDQITNFFGGDKKKRTKVSIHASFRTALGLFVSRTSLLS